MVDQQLQTLVIPKHRELYHDELVAEDNSCGFVLNEYLKCFIIIISLTHFNYIMYDTFVVY